MFEAPECWTGALLKSHLTPVDRSDQPGDRFLRLHFQRCLVHSAGRGDVLEDYRPQEIQAFMEELGVFDNEIDFRDPGWSTPLGIEVHAQLIREKIARWVLLPSFGCDCLTMFIRHAEEEDPL